MKHPILYRVGMYSCIGAMTTTILFLLHLMNEAPFNSEDMRSAHMYGCQLISKPLTDESIDKCTNNANNFKDTLDDLDKQMELIDARRKQVE